MKVTVSLDPALTGGTSELEVDAIPTDTPGLVLTRGLACDLSRTEWVSLTSEPTGRQLGEFVSFDLALDLARRLGEFDIDWTTATMDEVRAHPLVSEMMKARDMRRELDACRVVIDEGFDWEGAE